MESTLCVVLFFNPRSLEDQLFVATERISEDDEDESNELETLSGNQNRRLWKSNCVQAALSVRLIKPTPFTVVLFLFFLAQAQ